jgi:hypothetical protein
VAVRLRFIREKFTDSFREACAEDTSVVSRDEFTMLLRSQLALELEAEEEEVTVRDRGLNQHLA